MITIACVLRVGGNTYNESWVKRLQSNLAKHLTIDYRFVCLTNLSSIEGVETIQLTEKWTSWWSKIELFKPNQFSSPVLYMDLDLLSCGNINTLCQDRDDFIMLKDCPVFRHVCNSGLMLWNPTKNNLLENIFHDFKKNYFEIMMEYSGQNGVTMFGDQGFISKTMEKYNQPIIKWQDILPEHWFLEFSYLDKINPIIENNSYNKDARICYSLGYPKFSNRPDLKLVRQHWTGLHK